MKLKYRPEDFRVRELLVPGAVTGSGEHRIYRIEKRKLSSAEAAAIVAREAGVRPSEVELAGLKDRQGVTVQHMSLRGGPPLSLRAPGLRIETLGSSREPIASKLVRGNAFAIVLRDLGPDELARLERGLEVVRAHGLPSYFDEQRFGNLRYRQGWIARDLVLGDVERALRELVCASGEYEQGELVRAKQAWRASWGDWEACRRIAKRFGRHRSLFEHLQESPQDFRGALGRIGRRERLIHLYAWQSHLWNRAVAELVRQTFAPAETLAIESREGPLLCYTEARAPFLEGASFRLPGAGLEDVREPAQLALYEEILARERLVPDQFRIEGLPGFELKGEDRPLVLRPRGLSARGPERDSAHRGRALLELAFELPRGSYATLVVKRLLADRPQPERRPARAYRPRTGPGADRGPRRGSGRRGGRA